MEAVKDKCIKLCESKVAESERAQFKDEIACLTPEEQLKCYTAYLHNDCHDQTDHRQSDQPVYECLCLSDYSILDLFPTTFQDHKNPAGWTILHHAAVSNKAGLVEKIMIKHPEFERAKNGKGQTPLMMAVRKAGLVEKIVIEHPEFDRAENGKGQTPVMMAVRNYEHTVSSLLKSTSQSLEDVLTEALHENKHQEDFECRATIISSILKEMKENSSRVSVKHLKMSLSFPANIIKLVSDDMKEDVSIEDYLNIISMCLKIDSVDEKEFRTLEEIIDRDKLHHKMVFDDLHTTDKNILEIIADSVTESTKKDLFINFLLSKNYLSNPCVVDKNSNTIGHYAAIANNIFLLLYIYQNRADFVSLDNRFILNIEDGDQKKPLWHTTDVLKLLVNLPDQIELLSLENVCGKTKQSVLHRAMEYFRNDHFEDLTTVGKREDLGNIFQCIDSHENSLLHYALSKPCNPKMLTLLLTQCAALVDRKNLYGWTPLHFVCRFETRERNATPNIEMLLDKGADKNVGTVCTPYKVALQNAHLTDKNRSDLRPSEDLITEEEEDFTGLDWFLEESLERREAIEVIWTIGAVPSNDKVLQHVQLLPGGEWFKKYKHYTNAILMFWSHVDRMCVSQECLEDCQLEKGDIPLTASPVTVHLTREGSHLLSWLKEKGFVGGEGEEEERSSVMSFDDVYAEYKEKVPSADERSVKRTLRELISHKLLLRVTLNSTEYIINLQHFVKTMKCLPYDEDMGAYLRKYLGADVWAETGEKTTKGPAAYTLKLGLHLKDIAQRPTLLFQPLCVALVRILAPTSVYRDDVDDTLELYLRSANITMTLDLEKHSISIITDESTFSARLFYVLRLALVETMISSLHCDYKVKILCNCGQSIGELTTLNKVETKVGVNKVVELDYKAPSLTQCPNNYCKVIQVPLEVTGNCNVQIRLSDITLEHQIKLDLPAHYSHIINDFHLTNEDTYDIDEGVTMTAPFLRVESNVLSKQTALFYLIVKKEGDKTLRDFYRANRNMQSMKEFALDLLQIHELDADDTLLWYEKFVYRWIGITAIISVLVVAIVVGLSESLGVDLGYTGLTAIPAVFAFSALIYKFKKTIELDKESEYKKVGPDGGGENKMIEMRGEQAERLGEIVDGFNDV